MFCIVGICFSCSDDDENLTASQEELFPELGNSEIDIQLREIFGDYNTRIEYLYVKKYLPDDWYRITPVQENLVIPMANFLKDYWVNPLEIGSSKDFVSTNFPKKIVFVGSPARKQDGTRVLGQAEGGTLIRFTEVNDFDLKKGAWVRQQLHTAFHEYAHVMHQTFKMPNDYRMVTPDNYTKQGWRAVQLSEAIERGMVTPYGTGAVQEDFAELFSGYITYTNNQLDYLFKDEKITKTTSPEEALKIIQRNKGRVFIRTKLGIMKKFLIANGLDLDAVRTDLQDKLSKK